MGRPTGVRWLWLSLLVVVLDRLTKTWATAALELHVAHPLVGGLNLTLMHNTGAAFSFLSDAGGWQRWLLAALAIMASVLIVWWLRAIASGRAWLACALALVLGGAIGNLCDRLLLGYVIDFVDVYYRGWHWPAFNVADSAISAGAVMLVFDSLRRP